MESFLSRYRNPLILLAVVLAQMLGLAVQVRRPATSNDSHQTRLLRYWVVSLISPFERGLLYSGHGISNTWHGYLDLRHIRSDNQQLRAELDRMRLEQASLAENARQDIRLEKLLGFQQQYVSKTVSAHVIGTSGTDLSRVLYIDKGSKDGLRADMPVITPDGVVGKVRDVFPHTAQVLELNDPTSGLGVILTQTRLRGILRGTRAGQTEIVDVLPDERIRPGEQVVTSGGDEVYPRGLPVGVVERTINDPERNPYVAILIRPAVNLSRLDEVLVITETTTTMPGIMQQDVATSEQKAADILSQRLPGASSGPTIGPDGKPIDSNAPPPPVHPPNALHPDHFTPGAVPPAAELTPGAAYSKQDYPALTLPSQERQPQPAAAAPRASPAPPSNTTPETQH
ncbi:MAG: rod shape-determining protein MreC [Acidobacteriaceae bacterium]